MGSWGDGPFENDTAADWSAELDAAAPADRAQVIRSALIAATDGGDYLDADLAQAAIAAAAVVAAQRPGGPPLDPTYAPQLIADGIVIELPDDIRELAVAALDRVGSEDSELRELWDEAPAFAAQLTSLREALLTPGNAP
jgi:hypothetical protein